jgi:cell division septation protein DedD
MRTLSKLVITIMIVLLAAIPLSVVSAASPITVLSVTQYKPTAPSQALYGHTVTYTVPADLAAHNIVCFNITATRGSSTPLGYYFFCYSNSVDSTTGGTQYVNGALVYTNNFSGTINNGTVMNGINTPAFSVENRFVNVGDRLTVNYYLLQGSSGHNGAGLKTALESAVPQVVAGSQGSYTLTVQAATPTPTPSSTPSPTPTATPTPKPTPTPTPVPKVTPPPITDGYTNMANFTGSLNSTPISTDTFTPPVKDYEIRMAFTPITPSANVDAVLVFGFDDSFYATHFTSGGTYYIHNGQPSYGDKSFYIEILSATNMQDYTIMVDYKTPSATVTPTPAPTATPTTQPSAQPTITPTPTPTMTLAPTGTPELTINPTDTATDAPAEAPELGGINWLGLIALFGFIIACIIVTVVLRVKRRGASNS